MTDRDDTINRPFDASDVATFAADADAHRRDPLTTRKMAVTITVEITVPEDADLETREYAAYEAARVALNDNVADWDAIDVED